MHENIENFPKGSWFLMLVRFKTTSSMSTYFSCECYRGQPFDICWLGGWGLGVGVLLKEYLCSLAAKSLVFALSSQVRWFGHNNLFISLMYRLKNVDLISQYIIFWYDDFTIETFLILWTVYIVGDGQKLQNSGSNSIVIWNPYHHGWMKRSTNLKLSPTVLTRMLFIR